MGTNKLNKLIILKKRKKKILTSVQYKLSFGLAYERFLDKQTQKNLEVAYLYVAIDLLKNLILENSVSPNLNLRMKKR